MSSWRELYFCRRWSSSSKKGCIYLLPSTVLVYVVVCKDSPLVNRGAVNPCTASRWLVERILRVPNVYNLYINSRNTAFRWRSCNRCEFLWKYKKRSSYLPNIRTPYKLARSYKYSVIRRQVMRWALGPLRVTASVAAIQVRCESGSVLFRSIYCVKCRAFTQHILPFKCQ